MRISSFSDALTKGIPWTIAIGILWVASAYARSGGEESCDALAWRIQTTAGAPSDRALTLEREAGRCAGQGAFDIRLAGLYLEAGRLDDAERVADRGIVKGSGYQPNLRQIKAEVLLRKGQTDEAYRAGQQVARDYPTYAPILGFLGEIDFKTHRWQQALEDDERLFEIQPSALALLGQAAALHQLKRHEECVQKVYRALKMDPSRIGQPTGVLEAIYSLGVLKRNAEAAELLKQHMAANPNWAQNPAMVTAAKALGLAP